MEENQSSKTNAENRKDKIRAKYQRAIPDGIDVIPATPQENIFEDKNEKQVALPSQLYSSGDTCALKTFVYSKLRIYSVYLD